MSNNTFTETSHSGLGGNIGQSIISALIGLVMLLVGVIGLFWNEGNYVKISKALEEAQGKVIAVADISSVNAANEGQVVHMSGDAVTNETLIDPIFEVEQHGLALIRKVLYYQWEEQSETKEEKELGGGTKTVTTYSYNKIWTDSPIASKDFNQKQYVNSVAIDNCREQRFSPSDVAFGAFTLSDEQIARIDNKKEFHLTDYSLPASLEDVATVQGDVVYVSNGNSTTGNTSEAQIGDMKVSWQAVAPTELISIIAQQKGSSFCPYVASSGREVDILGVGIQTQDELFAVAHSDNSVQLWVFRVIGIFVICIACSLVAGPLEAVTNIIPFLGSIVGAVSKFIAFIIGLMISMIVIAAAWIFYRPLIGIGCLLIVVGILYLLKKLRKKPSPAEA